MARPPATTPRWSPSPTPSTPWPPSSGKDEFVTESTAGASEDVARAHAALVALRAEVGKAVVGQDAAVTGLVIALICRGHVLLEGVPGIAKTLLVRSFCRALDLRTTR